jgi:hypothetical protein
MDAGVRPVPQPPSAQSSVRSFAGVTLVTLLWLALGCAHGQPPPPVDAPPPAPLLPLPRSSIAAVIAHQGELGLTPEQVDRLIARDAELDKVQTALREAQSHQAAPGRARTSASPAAGQPSGGSPSDAPPPVVPPGSPAGGGYGGRHRGQPRTQTSQAQPTGPKLEDQLDDNDTRAYLAAEADILTEAQRDPAREIAEKYREALYDQRSRAAAGQ